MVSSVCQANTKHPPVEQIVNGRVFFSDPAGPWYDIRMSAVDLKRALCEMKRDTKDSRVAESLGMWPQIVPHETWGAKLVPEAPRTSLAGYR